MTDKMDWKLLWLNRCPSCRKDWVFNLTVVNGIMRHNSCGFEISENKYKEIINDRANARVEEYSKMPDRPFEYGRSLEVNTAGQELF